jgi:hypothetical protein
MSKKREGTFRLPRGGRREWFVVWCLVGLLAGCAPGANSNLESITIASTPVGAQVTVLGRSYVTPAIIQIPRDKPFRVCVAAPGYAAQSVYDDTMAHWQYGHACRQAEPDCTSDMSMPTTTHTRTDINVRLHPCPSAGPCPRCAG